MANGFAYPCHRYPNTMLTSHHSASLVIGLVFVVIASLLAYFFSPKGENQTYVTPATALFPLAVRTSKFVDREFGYRAFMMEWSRENYANSSDCHSVWRSSLILSFASCYIMWGASIPVARVSQCRSIDITAFLKDLTLRNSHVMSWLTVHLYSSDNIHGAMAPAHLAFELRIKTFSRALMPLMFRILEVDSILVRRVCQI